MASIGSAHYTDHYLEDIHITEKEKSKEWYLKDNIDYWIANLVRERRYIGTLRNYYSGVRSEDEFRHMTENFGIGTPSSLNFTPLIKPRVDALLSQIEDEAFTYRVSCTDDKTIDVIQEEKKKKHLDEIGVQIKNFAKIAANVFAEEKQKDPNAKIKHIPELDRNIKNIENNYGDNYISDLEIAAQRVLKFFELDYRMDMRQKLKQLMLDVFVTGEGYYRVYVDRIGADPVLEVIKPENIFYNKNTNSQYLDTVDAIVHREYLTRKEILKKYGKFMDDEQREYIFGDRARTRTARSLRSGMDLELYYQNDDPLWGQKSYTNLDVVEVLHVEWLAMNEVPYTQADIEGEQQTDGYKSKVRKKAYRVDRYEGTRIAGSVYVNAGKSKHIVRSETRPYECEFTYGGVMYNDRHGRAYSIVGAMKDLQDVYDLTLFYRDNLIANSGVPGDRVNIAGIPRQLGDEFMERLMKFIALKKNGFELIDPTEPGAQMFQHYGSFDNSVNGQSLQGINTVLQMMEKQADLIAGVNQQMLGQIAERDAVGNVKQGIQQTLKMNQDLYELLRTNQKRLLTSMLNSSKVSYKGGKKISYVAGNNSYSFDIMPDTYCFADYSIHITYSSKDAMKLQDLKIIAKEYANNGLIDPDVLTYVVLSDSVTEINMLIRDSWSKKKKENDELGQAQQQLEEFDKQLKDITNKLSQSEQQIKAYEKEGMQLRSRELDIKEKEVNNKYLLEDKAANQDSSFKDDEIQLKREVVELERDQLYLGVGNEREPKNI